MQQLRYFLMVLECGSFSRAAEELGRSQQAISRAVRTLEDHVGVRLLDRGTGRVKATAFGDMLAVHARGIAGHESAFLKEVRHALGSQQGTIRIGAGPAVAGIAFEAVAAAREIHPDLVSTVFAGIQSSFIGMLLEGAIDIAVCMDLESPRDASDQLVKEVLTSDTYCVLAGGSHPLAAAKSVSATTLRDQKWALGLSTGEIGIAWREAFAVADVSPPVPVIDTNSVEFCRSALASGEWLTLMPRGLFEQELAAGTVVAVDAPGFSWQRQVVMTYKRASVRSGPVLALMDILHQAGRRRSPVVATSREDREPT